jgi:glycosyl transferase family 25
MKKISLCGLIFFFAAVALFSNNFFRILIGVEAILLFYCARIFQKSHNADCDNFKESNSGGVGAYLINLDRAADRLKFVTRSVEALDLPMERIAAVDGKTLSAEKIESVADLKIYQRLFKMSPEVGTIGCALSHEKAWRKFLDSDNEFAIIFEDDVQFDPQELSAIIKSAIEKKTLWDILNFETKHGNCFVKISPLSSKRNIVFYLTNATHAGCYLINRKAARRLLKKFYPIKMPLDHYFTTVWELDLIFAGVEPRMVFQTLGNSQIKISTPEKKATPSILAINAVHNIQRAILHFTYNLCCFLMKRRRVVGGAIIIFILIG